MKIPYSLITKLVDLPHTATQIGEILTMLGFELESIEGKEPNEILDVKIMSNRGDTLSALGLSRELLTKLENVSPTQEYQKINQTLDIQITPHPSFTVHISTPSCTRYSYMIIKDLKNQPSPPHIQKTLEQSGIKPISLLVDLTNYILIEMGHPMHAFDFNKLKGQKVIIREAQQGETVQLLNEQKITLQPHHMVICDHSQPIALAGIMGGTLTQIDETTTEILLEAAHFAPSNIRKTRKDLGLNTEASYRFERWVDPETTLNALQRYLDLYKKCTGHSPSIQTYSDLYLQPKKNLPVQLRFSKVQKLIGIEIPQETTLLILKKLGFKLEQQENSLLATPPSWRQDILREEDLIEEVARVYGYENIIEQVPKTTTLQGGTLGTYQQLESIYEGLFRSGFNQTINHTLSGPHPLDQPHAQPIMLRTPHSPSAERLRSSLLPKICETYLRGSQKSQHLFEIGKIFHQSHGNYKEHRSLGILSTGNLSNPHWTQKKPQNADFFTLKGTLEYLSNILKINLDIRSTTQPDPRLHPNRQAEIWTQTTKIGSLGQIHPDLASSEKLPKETFVAEINLNELLKENPHPIQTKPISRYPSIIRDLALIVPKTISYKSIEETILNSKIKELETWSVFDLYESKEIKQDHYSLGISFVFRHINKNLTDQEANNLRKQILKLLQPFNIFLRSE